MSILHLDKLLRPQRVAVIGASDDARKVGHAVLRNLLSGGFAGEVCPVNPRHTRLLDRPTWPDITRVPGPVDLAVICTPAASVAELVRQCGSAGVPAVLIISAGFREIGPAGAALEQAVRSAAAEFPGLRILGPNCLGALVPGTGLNASFAAALPQAGRVAFLSQSGALCTAVLDWARGEGVGFSHFISLGNMLDVDFADLIDYLAADEHTDAVLLYVESLSRCREFMSAARALARRKPLVVCKSGRFAASAQAAASHTGAMAGVDAVYDAAFQRAGIVRVADVAELFDCAELLARRTAPVGPRLAIVTNAGGPGVMAVDAVAQCRGQLAALSPHTVAQLDAALPAYWSHGNPVDILGDASPQRYEAALQAILRDDGVDAALVILTPQAMTDPTATAEAVCRQHAGTRKTILSCWMGGPSVQPGMAKLNAAGVPTYAAPEAAVRAFSHLVEHTRRQELLGETPRETPIGFALDAARRQSLLRDALPPPAPGETGPPVVLPPLARQLLAAYEIPIAPALAADSAETAVALARQIGFPVALKILSPDISHKTDVGGVLLGLQDEAAVAAGYQRVLAAVRAAQPTAQLHGVTVERMVQAPYGFELMLGSKQDAAFGAVILLAAGGVATEVLADRALGLPPLNERLARRLIESLRMWPLLAGYRGRPAVNVSRLVEVLIRFSTLVAEHPEIDQLDINPLLVTPDAVTAVDARVSLHSEHWRTPPRPFAHLAIRPYPDELTGRIQTRDGQELAVRAIRPEDEPAWLAFLDRCSPESLRYRFRYLFKRATHEMAARFCFIDYDRETALVAEAELPGGRGIVGVGRLVVEPDRQSAEYAVLIEDAWQGRGLGGALLDRCLEIARSWGVRRVYGEAARDNTRMLALFKSRGFTFSSADEPGTALAERELE